MSERGAGGAEPLSERGLMPAGIVGAAGGAVGAVGLCAAAGTAHLEACGAAGAMAGSVAAALGWWAVASAAGLIKRYASRGAMSVARPAAQSA
ncbi:hypothetical protein R5W24_005868 [Gemmata sp. JC717]|uniref:hypothetical protein n=1 Tax=Gemmata algarum TaxID=2975278 RepID=UPI0021BB1552|nr:hypothetical protein [Gemmata algarum]MDY3556698.1 hypothetical protein [Gemmata algarum]